MFCAPLSENQNRCIQNWHIKPFLAAYNNLIYDDNECGLGYGYIAIIKKLQYETCIKKKKSTAFDIIIITRSD